MRLAEGLRRNSRWPKKNVKRKKKILATKVEVSGFPVDFNVSGYREVLDLLQVVRSFFVSTELLYLKLIILVSII